MKKIKLTRDEFRMFSLRSQIKLINKDGILLLQVLSKTGYTRRFYSVYNFNVLVLLSNGRTRVIIMSRNSYPESILEEIKLGGLF